MTLWDDRILEILADEGSSTPSAIADMDIVRRSRPTINTRLRKLDEAGLVEKRGRGLYAITDIGELYLIGGYDVEKEETTVDLTTEGDCDFDRLQLEIGQIVDRAFQ
jgi:DNA-binding Lrp family transcriptional regulator